MATRTAVRAGFTLVELMVVVSIVGLLAVIATPAFIGYVKRAKTSEAADNLKQMFSDANDYYQLERQPRDATAAYVVRCLISSSTALRPANPSGSKQSFAADSGFSALGFNIGDPVYFGYQAVVMASAGCNTDPSEGSVYSFRAHGDLDGDDTESTFELSVGTNAMAELYKSAGFYVVNELE